MAPKRKAAAASSSSSSKHLTLKFVEGNNYTPVAEAPTSSHPAKRARIEGPEGNEGVEGEIQGEEDVNPVKSANAEVGKTGKKRARTLGGSKRALRAQSSQEDVQVQAALKGPVGTGRQPKAKARKSKAKGVPAAVAAMAVVQGGLEEETVQNELDLQQEQQETVVESQQATQTQSQSLEDLEHDELTHTPEEETLPPPHTTEHFSVSPAQDMSPPEHQLAYPPPPPPPPHAYYAHAYPHPSHPYIGGAYPPPHAHYAPGGVDYPTGSFTTIDTTPGGSFHSHSSYVDTNGAPAGNPFPPEGGPEPHSLYAPPPYAVPPQPHVEEDEGPAGEEAEEPIVEEEYHPPGVPYTGADGRKRVPVKPSGQRTSRADHVACHFCRGRKLKCDGRRPACGHCGLRNIACSYDQFIRRRGPGKKEKNAKRKGVAAEAGGPGAAEGEETSPTPGPSTAPLDGGLHPVEMHFHTIDPDDPSASLPPHSPSPAPAPAPPAPRPRPRPRRWLPPLSAAELQLRPVPRPHVGPMPTPDPPKNPHKRRRTTGQSVMMSATILRLREEAGPGNLKPGVAAYAVGSNERMGDEDEDEVGAGGGGGGAAVVGRGARGIEHQVSFYYPPGHPGHHHHGVGVGTSGGVDEGSGGPFTPGAYARQGPVGEVVEARYADEQYGREDGEEENEGEEGGDEGDEDEEGEYQGEPGGYAQDASGGWPAESPGGGM